MLIPQFTIGRLLGIVAVFAVISLIASLAVQGQVWAIAVTVTVASVVVLASVHVGFFFLVWIISLIVGLFQQTHASSPFARKGPPPSISPGEAVE